MDALDLLGRVPSFVWNISRHECVRGTVEPRTSRNVSRHGSMRTSFLDRPLGVLDSTFQLLGPLGMKHVVSWSSSFITLLRSRPPAFPTRLSAYYSYRITS